MYRIRLVNMPFASLNMPSIALTQLRSVAEERFGDQVSVDVHYLNQDFAGFLGLETYNLLSGVQASNAGLGDWFFRQIAFPGLPDNTDEYFQRYFPRRGQELEEKKRQVTSKRAVLKRYLKRLIAKYKLADADLVGFTSMFSQNLANFALAQLLKEKNPDLVTVMGGANCEAPMGAELARHVDAIDFVFSGPGLVSFPTFVEAQMTGCEAKCHDIRGVFSAQNVDEKATGGVASIGEELPIEVPVPLDYEPFLADFQKSFPNGEVAAYLTFETSRGCWWGERSHCTFCGLNGGSMAYRAMPAEMALEMLRDMLAKYGDRCHHFESVDNIMPREYLTQVFDQLETPPGVEFFYEVKADLKEREMEILGRAGVTSIQPGIESLASSTLKLMGKGTTSFQNLNFLKNCVLYGIRPAWNLLIGFPGEDPAVYEKYLQDLPLMPHLPPPSGAFPVRFDRYSPYYTRADSYGLELSPYAFYSFIYPFPEETLMNMAYYFEDRNYNATYLSNLVAWQNKLAGAAQQWIQRWHGRDGKPKATLEVRRRGDGAVVIDNRTGERREVELDALELAVLETVDSKGLKTKSIATRASVDVVMVERAVDRMARARLLFEEDGRYLSLVLDRERREMEKSAGVVAAASEARRGLQPIAG
ncbi:MAG: RiPP maturation radical SAM C-methyltransferase [Acidobacteriota bacterium]